MSKNILVLGNGFISSHLNYTKCTHRIIPDENDIRALYDKYKPSVIINTIGYGGQKNIDDCEQNKSKTILCNTILPVMIADVAREYGCHYVNISSGCVFSGTSPNIKFGLNGKKIDFGWNENNFANPPSFYSSTKYANDLILQAYPHTTLLRIRMPISGKPNQRNLITKLLSYKKVVDVDNSITFVSDLVRAIDFVIEKELFGIFNIAHPTPMKHSKLLDIYSKHRKHSYQKIDANELDTMTVAKRSNCILDMRKIINAGFEFSDFDKKLHRNIEEYINNTK